MIVLIHGLISLIVFRNNKYIFLRLINFFNPYASSFSMLHFLLNLLQTFIIIISIFYGRILVIKL